MTKLAHNVKIINQLNNLPNSFLVSIINVQHYHFQIIDNLYIWVWLICASKAYIFLIYFRKFLIEN